MEVSNEFWENDVRLDYVIDMLTTLGDMIAEIDCPLLTYFLNLASEQARDEYKDVMRQTWRGSVPRICMRLN
jgi:hypothetical protein